MMSALTQSASRALCSAAGPVFDAAMLRYLACPLTKAPLRYDEVAQELVSEASGLAFPIVDGVPHLDPTSARVAVAAVEGSAA